MRRTDFIENILGGVFAVIAVCAAVLEMVVNGVSTETVIACIKDVFGTLVVVVLFLAIIKDKIPSRDFKKAFDRAMEDVCEKYSPLVRKEVFTLPSDGVETKQQLAKAAKLNSVLCYEMADNINVLFKEPCNNYKRFLEISTKNNETIVTLLIRKTFFNHANFSENTLLTVENKIHTNLSARYGSYKCQNNPSASTVTINFGRQLINKHDAAELAELVDHAIMLYIAESKK